MLANRLTTSLIVHGRAVPQLPPAPRAAPPAHTPVPARTLADALVRTRRVPPRLQGALLRACTEPRPFRSVARLATAAACDRRTLWRDWRRAVGAGADLRLEDVLHWLILARAVALKTPARSWCDVADELGVHPHTLARFARDFTGHTLRGLLRGGVSAAVDALERRILPHLADADPAQLPRLRDAS